MNRLSAAAAVVLGAGSLGLVTLVAESASVAASGCPATVTITHNDGGMSTHLGLSVSGTATAGSCVAFANDTSATITVSIDNGTGFTVASGVTDTGDFTPSQATTYDVDAKGTFKGLGGVVSYKAERSDTLSVSKPPHQTKSSSPTPSKHRTTTPPTGPDVAPSPTHHHHKHHGASAGPSPTVSLPPIPPLSTVSSAPDPGTHPTVAPNLTDSPSDPAEPGLAVSTAPASPAASTRQSDTGGSSRGLPAAVAVVLILGAAAGLVRVLRRDAAGVA